MTKREQKRMLSYMRKNAGSWLIKILLVMYRVPHDIPKLSVSNVLIDGIFNGFSRFYSLKFETLKRLPILPHLRRQMPSRIDHYNGKASSLYMRQPRQSLKLGPKLSVLNFYKYEIVIAKSNDFSLSRRRCPVPRIRRCSPLHRRDSHLAI